MTWFPAVGPGGGAARDRTGRLRRPAHPADRGGGRRVRDLDALDDVPTDLAEAVFTRYTNHDTGDSALATDLLVRAAELTVARGGSGPAPVSDLVRGLAEDGDDACLHELFFSAGRRWEEQAAVAEAVACHHNAVHWCGVDDEDHHADAVARVRGPAEAHAHPDYRRYLWEYQVEG